MKKTVAASILIAMLTGLSAEFLTWQSVKATVKKHGIQLKRIDRIERLLCLIARDVTKNPRRVEKMCDL